MATMVVVLGGIGAAMTLSSRSVTMRDDSQSELRLGAEVLAQLNDELRYATGLTHASANKITFSVDRGGSSRTIEYEWEGDQGDSLTKRVDSSDPSVLLTEIDAFELSYQTAVPRQPESKPEPGSEEILSSHDPASNQNTFSIRATEWVGQCFSIPFPEGTTSWSVTRVKFLAQVNGNKDGVIAVQIRSATDGGLPAGTLLESFSLPESSLKSSYTWQEVAFSNVADLSPDKGVCLVLGVAKSDDVIADIAFDNGAGNGYVTSRDGGNSWSRESGKAVQHVLYGQATKRQTAEPVSEVVENIRVRLTPTVTQVPLHALVTTLNQPEFSK